MAEEINYTFEVVKLLVSGGIGWFCGYKTTVRGEKRKEFNNLTDPLRQKIKTQISSLKSSKTLSANIETKDFEIIYDHLNIYQAHILRSLVSRYEANLKTLYTRDGYGKYTPAFEYSASRLVKDIESLLESIKRK